MEDIKKHSKESKISHILLCISSSAASQKTIFMAAGIAARHQASLTAVYIQTERRKDRLNAKKRQQLDWNLSQAAKEGAEVMILHAKDIASGIIKFTEQNAIDCIVLGDSLLTSQKTNRHSLSEILSNRLPDISIYSCTHINENEIRLKNNSKTIIWKVIKDFLMMSIVLIILTIIGFILEKWGFHDINIIMIYFVGVLLAAIYTYFTLSCYIFSTLTVIAFNYFFIQPTMTLKVYDKSYVGTFFVMFITTFLISSITNKVKNMASISSRRALRMELLLETSQKLQKAVNSDDVMQKVIWQIAHALEKNVLYFMGNPEKQNKKEYCYQKKTFRSLSESESEAAVYAYEQHCRTGYSTNLFSDSKYLFLPVQNGNKVYSIIGIDLEDTPISYFEEGIVIAILSECALAMEKEEFVVKQNDAFTKLKQEQLRANLLRSISHDLRTPLTSISGNASALLTESSKMSEDQKKQMYSDIQEDSLWLINLVENLLSVTRIENGSMQLNIQYEIISDVAEEAISHVRPRPKQHINFHDTDEILMSKIDARLMIQVLMNILTNAIKYSYEDSTIDVYLYSEKEHCIIEISDNGPGIKDEEKAHIFETFYSAKRKIADGRRGMGLGLSLCQSIIQAHGAKIEVLDHLPNGATFKIYLKKEKVEL